MRDRIAMLNICNIIYIYIYTLLIEIINDFSEFSLLFYGQTTSILTTGL